MGDKIIKKRRKNTLKWFIFVLMLLVTSVVVTVNLRMFQTYLGRKVSEIVTEKIQTPFSVERIKLGHFLRIEMQNVKVLDEYYDTLLRADELSFRLTGIDKENRDIHFSDLNGNNVSFHLIKHPGDSVLNIDHITDRLNDTTQHESWSIGFRDATLNDTHFMLDDNNSDHSTEGIDFNHLDIRNMDARLQNFMVKNDTISAWIQYLNAREKSGLILSDLNAHFKISPTGMEGNYVRVVTPKSLLFMNFEFDYYDYKDLGDFVNTVYMNGKLHDCRISTADMKYFVPQLSGMDNKARISGVFDGRVNDLKGKDIIMEYGKDTRFFGSLAMKGLPEFGDTFIDADIKTFVTTERDMKSIEIGEYDSIPMPPSLDKVTKIRLKGKFKGTPDVFTSRAMLSTNLGSVSADLTMDKDSKGTPVYEGVISGDSLLLGMITNMQEVLGSMNLHAEVQGRGLGENTRVNIDGYVNNLGFRGNTYDSLMITGKAGANSFSGDLKIRDENINLDFTGLADFSSRRPHFDFTSKIRDAYLNKLRISNKSDSLSKLSVVVRADFTGSNIDSLSGMAKLQELIYQRDNFVYSMDSLVVKTDLHQAENKRMSIQSDFMDGQVKGRFNISSLTKSYTNLMHHYLPAVFVYDSLETATPEFDFSFHLKDTRGVSHIFMPSLQITPDSYIEGKYGVNGNNLMLKTRIDTLYFSNIKFGNLALKTSSQDKHYHTEVSTEEIILKDLQNEKTDALGIERFKLDTRVLKDSVLYAITWDDKDDRDRNKALIKGNMAFDRVKSFTHRITQSQITINDTLWRFDPANYIVVNDSSVYFSNFAVESEKQAFSVEGMVSDNPEDVFRVDFREFNLSNFDLIFSAGGIDADGILNGFLKFNNLRANPKFVGDVGIQGLHFNGEKLGDASLYSYWVDSLQTLDIETDIVYQGDAGTRDLLKVRGNYWPQAAHGSDSLEMTAEVNNFAVSALQPFFEDFLNEINGWASGQLSLTGSTAKPELIGEMSLTRSKMNMGYLKTDYYLADKIRLKPHAIVFDSIHIYDRKGNSAILKGEVRHNYFDDFELDLHIDAQNFAGLNTTRLDNDLFYGEAFATGRVDITGPTDDITLNVRAKTEPNTRVVIPISTAESVKENDFVVFMKQEKEQKEERITFRKFDAGGLNMNFELEITNDAEAEIILPFSMGNIKGRGGGNLKLEITSAGNFNMYGDYIIEEGSFLFKLQNMLRRSFSIERGGTISWSGDPYDAEINISAIYEVRPTLKGLPASESIDPALANERIPVNCIINLKDKLFNPNIRFDIELPASDNRVKELVYSSIDTTSRTEMNKQMLYLLVLNSFSVTGMDNSLTSDLGASSLDLLSNQISSWLSQISKDFDIGINYRPSDTYTSEELEVALSTQLFDDRVSIDGNFGVTNLQEQTQAQTNNLVGDINIDVKITKDGRFRIKAFNQTNNVDLLDVGAPYTQGLGVFYRKEFDNLGELFRRKVKQDAMNGE